MDSTVLTIVVIVVMLVIVGLQIAAELVRRNQFKKLRQEMFSGQFDAFFARVDGALCRRLFTAYNRDYLKLNAYMMQDDADKVTEQFDHMLERRLPKKQRRDLVAKAFNFFVMQRDAARSDKLLAEIKTWHDERLEAGCAQLYAILIEKKSDYLEEMEQSLDAANDEQRGYLEFLIAEQYENRGDAKQAARYRKRSKHHMNKAARAE